MTAFPIVFLASLLTAPEDGLVFDAGFLYRLRETVVQNAPGLPGGGSKVPSSNPRKDISHGFRSDFYPWFSASYHEYAFKVGLAHVFTEHVEGNRTPWRDRPNRMPGLVTLNNLYFEGIGLSDGFVDFRIGRQDMMENRKSVFGLDWLLWDGTPGDSSETYFSDMARFAFHFSEVSKLDVFALYNTSKNALSVGREVTRHRALNRLMNSDSEDMDQWGGGLVWHSEFARQFPYHLYSIFKGDEPYYRGDERQPGKRIVTLGAKFLPHLTDWLWLDLDAAKQLGCRTNGREAGGVMTYLGLAGRGERKWYGTPYGQSGLFYMSGDKHRLDADDSDTGWDPLWRRTSAPSEVFNNGAHPALRYWTNMLWYNTLLGLDFSRHHRLEAYSGPVFAAVDDGLGGGDGSYKGLLSRVNYYLPFLLGDPKGSGLDRLEIYCAFCIELFNPGDYYVSTKPATYIRWMLNIKF